MNFFQPITWLSRASLSGRLLRIAALFLGLYALTLSLSPAIRGLPPEGLSGLRWAHWIGVAAWLSAFFWLHREVRRKLPEQDGVLIPVAALLTGWGLLSIWRLTPLFGLRQSLWLLICTALFVALLRFKDRVLPTLRRYKYLWLLAGFSLTALTFFFGTNPSGIGPRLWLGCCGIFFQPSEPLKLLLIIFLAAYLADRQALMPGLLPLLAPTFVMTGMALLLLLIQRDLGTAWVFIFIYTTLIYIATGEGRILLVSLLSVSLALLLGNELVALIHLRVEAWLNPWQDPSGNAYQIVQGLLAIAAGGLVGRGPGLGAPGFVPVAHTDFIYTSIVEESGLLGAVGLLLLVSLLALRALRISMQAEDNYARYLAVGVSAYLAGQSLLIIGGNIRMLPLTGVTLPFVSYGGSSLLTSFFALLLLALISHRRESQGWGIVRTKSSLHVAGAILALFGLAALISGWWGLVRAPDLLKRPDNARRTISDSVVLRGALLDRDGEALSSTIGESGNYSRSYHFPELGPVLGYSHPNYGQAGLEKGLDAILRGEELQPAFIEWLNQILYGQPPPGFDVRVSLDAGLQREAASLLGGERGAVVLLNASSGEILVMTSGPSFDANRLDENWEALSSSEGSALLNRAAQGAYPPGSALAPLIYIAARGQGLVPPEPGELSYTFENNTWQCLQTPADADSWDDVILAACPGPIAQLGLALGSEKLLALYKDLGFYQAPNLRLASFSQSAPASLARPGLAALGQDGLLISPLQMALATSTLSNFGGIPAPRIALSTEVGGESGVELDPLGEPKTVLNSTISAATAQKLENSPLHIWEAIGRAIGAEGETYTWYLAGNLPGQVDAARSFTIAVLLEREAPALARSIGQRLLLLTFEE